MQTYSKRVLITGINGFTGRYVSAALSTAGYEVFGFGSHVDQSNEHCFSVDLTDFAAVKAVVLKIKPHFVVHLAGITFVDHHDSNAFYAVNVGGTRNLLQALSELPECPEAILLASSANVYGNTVSGRLNEKTPFNPSNDYAVSKVAMEFMAKLWFKKLPIFIVRPFNYTGCGQADQFLIPKIVKHFKARKETIELGNLDVWRDFSDVRTFAAIYTQLLRCKPIGETINIASGKMYSLREIIAICEELTGHQMQIKVNPEFVRNNEIKELCGDISLLQSLTSETDFFSLRDTLFWMLNN